MQLLIILAILLYGSKAGGNDILNKEIFNEARPILENFGGNEVKEAFKNAERISEVLSAVQQLTGGELSEIFRPEQPPLRIEQPSFGYERSEENEGNGYSQSFSKSPVSFPLAPISLIADKDITYSLSRYIEQN